MKKTKIIIISLLLTIIPNLCIARFSDGFRAGAEAGAKREAAAAEKERIKLEREKFEYEKKQTKQQQMLEICKTVWKDNPQEMIKCSKEVLDD